MSILKHAWSSAQDVARFVIWVMVFTISVVILSGCAAAIWVVIDLMLGLMSLWAVPVLLLLFLMSAWFTVFMAKVVRGK